MTYGYYQCVDFTTNSANYELFEDAGISAAIMERMGIATQADYQRKIDSGIDIDFIIVATAELDVGTDTIWSWQATTSPYGSYRLSYDIQENLPSDIFTLPPTVSMMCYATGDTNYSFINVCSAPPSNTYIGKWQTFMLDKIGAGENKPNAFHIVIQAIGF